MWSPGVVTWRLRAGEEAHFVCSTEPVSVAGALEALHRPVEKMVAARVAEIVREAGKPDPERRVIRADVVKR